MTEILEKNDTSYENIEEVKKNADEPVTKTIRYDGMIKDILWHLDSKNVIATVNALYGCDLSPDSEVVYLETETQNEENERNADFHIKIGDRFFHMEVQSNEDGSMAFRIFEYGFRAALMFYYFPLFRFSL